MRYSSTGVHERQRVESRKNYRLLNELFLSSGTNCLVPFCSEVGWRWKHCRWNRWPCWLLLLLPKHLPIGLAIGIKAVPLTSFPSGFQFGRGDIPVRTTFPQHSAQVLPKLFNGWPAKKPVAIVHLVYNPTRFEDDDMWDHRIVFGVRDVEIL